MISANKILGSLCLTIFGFVSSHVVVAADNGAKLYEDNCFDCHKSKKKTLDNKHLSRSEWKEQIDLMIEKDKLDPPISKEDYAILLDWLVETRGSVNPSTAGSASATDTDNGGRK